MESELQAHSKGQDSLEEGSQVSKHTRVHRAAWISVVASFFIFAVKLSAYFQTGSTAVLSDALESIVNVLAAVGALFVIRFVTAPADQNHPYGHGKLEYFSSAFEGGLIAFASIMIALGAGQALLNKTTLNKVDTGIIFLSVTAVANFLLSRYLRKAAKDSGSEALLASSEHILSDVWSSVGVIAGLSLLQVTGWWWVDPVVALGVAVQLGWNGAQIVRRSFGGLLDEMEPASISEIAQAFHKTRRPGLIDLHNVKIIRSGRFHHIDGHIVIPEFWSIAEAHESIKQFEKEVLSHYQFDGEIALHLDPCARAFCSRCDLANCAIRKREIASLPKLDFLHLISGPQKDSD